MMEGVMEFQSTQKKTAPPSHVCVIYDPLDGRIVHGHVFVGEGTGLFGLEGRDERERETLEGARRNHGDLSRLRVLHAPAAFRLAPNVAYRVDVRRAGWSSATKFRMSGRHENRRRRPRR